MKASAPRSPDGPTWMPPADAVPVALLQTDADGRIQAANAAAAALLGEDADRLHGQTLTEVLPGDPPGPAPEARFAIRADRRPCAVQARGLRQDDGCLVVALFPDDARRTLERTLGRVGAEYQAIFEAVPTLIWFKDRQNRYLRLNPAAAAAFGRPVDQIEGRAAQDFLPTDLAQRDHQEDLDVLRSGQPKRGLVLALPGGAGRTLALQVDKLPYYDADGAPTGVIGLATDVTERERVAETVRRVAYYDPLTGLANRLLFSDRLERALATARREGTQLAILVLDIDRFKVINDGLGHPAGDEVLQAMAHRLSACVREQDSVCRLAGDEFALTAQGVEHFRDVLRLAERLRHDLGQPITVAGRELFATVTIGSSLYPADGSDVDTLVRNAESALHRAKEHHTGHAFYNPAITSRASSHLDLERGLRRVLERGELVLHYQPIFQLNPPGVAGVEALARWRHPERGLLPPTAFIGLAEDTGMIVPIGAWVLRTACAQVFAWERAGLGKLGVSVNLSALQLQDHRLVSQITEILADTGLAPDRLTLELTEGMVMGTRGRPGQALRSLKAMGVQLAIDDFGTGYSSLSYLQQFTVDTLKIDRSFLAQVRSAGDPCPVARAVIALAHSLNLRVVAEGVENAVQLDCLRRDGCDGLQGYLLCRPLPADELASRLVDRLPQAIRLNR